MYGFQLIDLLLEVGWEVGIKRETQFGESSLFESSVYYVGI